MNYDKEQLWWKIGFIEEIANETGSNLDKVKILNTLLEDRVIIEYYWTRCIDTELNFFASLVAHYLEELEKL